MWKPRGAPYLEVKRAGEFQPGRLLGNGITWLGMGHSRQRIQNLVSGET